MDTTQQGSAESSPWKHALSFLSQAIVRVPRAWDRVPAPSYAHKEKKIWKRPDTINKTAKSNDDVEDSQGNSTTEHGAKRLRVNQMPPAPQVVRGKKQYAATKQDEIAATPKRKVVRRQSLRTATMKNAMASAGARPSKEEQTQAYLDEAELDVKDDTNDDEDAQASELGPKAQTEQLLVVDDVARDENFGGSEIATEPEIDTETTVPRNEQDQEESALALEKLEADERAKADEDVTVEAPQTASSEQDEQTPVEQIERTPQDAIFEPNETQETAENASNAHATEESQAEGLEQEVNEAKASQPIMTAQIQVPLVHSSPHKSKSRRISVPRRVSSRLSSKRQSDVGPKGVGKASFSPQKRRSFGLGQPFKFDAADLPTLSELKSFETQLPTTPEENKAEKTVAESNGETPAAPRDTPNLSPDNEENLVTDSDALLAPSNDGWELSIPEAETEKCTDEILAIDLLQPFDKIAENGNGTKEQGTNTPESQLPKGIMKTVETISGDYHDTLNHGILDEEISDDELGKSPSPDLMPIDDDATVPVFSPAYKANTRHSPPPKSTSSLKDPVPQNGLEEPTEEITARIPIPPGMEDSVTEVLAESSGSLPQEVAPKRTRSGARFSDDTSILKEFLNRAHARKAAQALQPAAPLVPVISPASATAVAPETSPRRSPRKVLGNLDRNSPSPTKPLAYTDRSGTLPHKAPLLQLQEEADDTLTIDPLSEPAQPLSSRRSARSRLPAPTRTHAAGGTTSFIPLRRADGSELVVLQRSYAQELASTTKSNTRRNKGQAKMPNVMLDTILKNASASPVKVKAKKTDAGRGKTAKAVEWDKKLVYYQDEEDVRDGPIAAKEEKVERKSTSTKRARASASISDSAKASATISAGSAGGGSSTPRAKCGAATPDSTKTNGTPGVKRRGRSKV